MPHSDDIEEFDPSSLFEGDATMTQAMHRAAMFIEMIGIEAGLYYGDDSFRSKLIGMCLLKLMHDDGVEDLDMIFQSAQGAGPQFRITSELTLIGEFGSTKVH